MAGKKIGALDIGVAQRTNEVAQQQGTDDATRITLADVLGLIQVGDIPDLSSTYQEVSEKDAANGYAGLNASAKLPTSTIDQDSATSGQALLWNGSQWSPGSVAVNLDQSTIYVSKTGNDSNSGENINEPKLTISNAITTADAEGYSLVWVVDSGTYAEDVTCIDGIDLYAPNATLSFGSTEQLTLAGQRTAIHKIVRSSGGGSCVLNTGAGDTSFLSVDTIEDSGSGVTVRNTQTTTLILKFGIIDVKGSGVAIADFTSGAHTHIYGQDIYLRSNGATGIQRTNAGLTVGYVEHIVVQDAATSTVAIDCNAGTLDVNVNEIDAAVAYDVESGATLNLFVNDIASGTRLNDGTTNVIALNADSFLSQDLTVTDINSTNAVSDTLTVDGTELDPTGHTEGQILQSNGTDFVPADLNLSANIVINPNFAIVQRQITPSTLTTYTDGSYCGDRWVLLTQDANGQFGQISGDTQRYAGQLKKTAAGTTRIGGIQWIEGVNCRHLRGETVTVQARVKCSQSSAAIRVGIIESTKTEDSITRDAVSDWTTTPVSLITDYSFAGTPGSVTSDTTWQDISYTTTLGSSFNNLAVMIWSETALSQDTTLDIEAVQLKAGPFPTPFEQRSAAFEDTLCKRYFEREVGSVYYYFAAGFVAATNFAFFAYRYAPKRAVPTFNTSALSTIGVVSGTTLLTASSIAFQYATKSGCRIRVGATLTAPAATAVLCNNTTAYFEMDAEL